MRLRVALIGAGLFAADEELRGTVDERGQVRVAGLWSLGNDADSDVRAFVFSPETCDL